MASVLGADMKKNIGKLVKELGLSANNIFHMVSYQTEQEERNFGIDLLTLRVFRAALNRAQEYITHTENNCGDYTSKNLSGKPPKEDNESIANFIAGGKIVSPNATHPVQESNPQSASSQGNTSSATPSATEVLCAACYEMKPAAASLHCHKKCCYSCEEPLGDKFTEFPQKENKKKTKKRRQKEEKRNYSVSHYSSLLLLVFILKKKINKNKQKKQ